MLNMMRFWNYGFQFLEGRAVPFRARSEGTANERRSRSRLRTTDRVYSAVSGEERLNVAFSLIAASWRISFRQGRRHGRSTYSPFIPADDGAGVPLHGAPVRGGAIVGYSRCSREETPAPCEVSAEANQSRSSVMASWSTFGSSTINPQGVG